MKTKIICGIILTGTLLSCDTCNNCGPVMDDPYFIIEFYEQQNRQTVIVKLDSVNKRPANELSSVLQNRASSFKLPLSPIDSVSLFELVFTELSAIIADTIQYNKKIQVNYQRWEHESNGIIKIIADQFRVIHHDFDSIAPTSFDQAKTTNELKLQLYL